MSATPVRQDKRLWLTVGTEIAIVGLMVARIVTGTEGLAALVTLTLAYVGQSQLGQVARSKVQALVARVTQPGLEEAEPEGDPNAAPATR